MVQSCVICKWNSDMVPQRSFHTFPSQQSQRQKWLDIIGKTNENVRKFATLCCIHFDESCFRYGLICGRKMIKPFSVPTLHLTVNKEKNKIKSGRKRFSEPNISEDVTGNITLATEPRQVTQDSDEKSVIEGLESADTESNEEPDSSVELIEKSQQSLLENSMLIEDGNLRFESRKPNLMLSIEPMKREFTKEDFQKMFCVQETESHMDPFANLDKDPLGAGGPSDSSDDEPAAKRLKTFNSSLDLKVYQIPAFNTPKSLSIFPSTPTSTLPKFVNNPLNLANPLALSSSIVNTNSIVKNLQSRYSLPAKLTITPVQTPTRSETGEVIRYKKNGEIAKKRGPPKGYKRKPKVDLSMSLTSAANAALLQAQNTILTSLLAASNTTLSVSSGALSGAPIAGPSLLHRQIVVHQEPIKVPEGTELVELLLDPEDWFPAEPYKMIFSRKKNPKWKNFPFRCEHCFKGYRVVSTLVQHAGERHGSVPRSLAIPCPCCPHVSTRRKHHKKHLETHEGRRHRIFCPYCLPPVDPTEPYVKESEKYPFDKFPQYWYASEESLRLHKKRKHPYAAMYNYNWFGTWGDTMPNS